MTRSTRAALLVGVMGLLPLAAGGCSSGSAAASGVAQAQLVGGAATRSALPPTEAATGSLVRGFPSQLLPLPPGVTVTASAVQRHEELMDVSVSATTPAPAKEVLSFYSATLTKAGFSQTKGSVLPVGAAGLAFSRDGGKELVVVAVADRGSDRSFSVGGTVTGDG